MLPTLGFMTFFPETNIPGRPAPSATTMVLERPSVMEATPLLGNRSPVGECVGLVKPL